MPSKKRFRSLTARKDFLDLKATGQVFHVNFWLLVNVRRNDLNSFRCGFTLTRHTGPAVLRNRMRRWGKEYLRRWVNARTENQTVGLDLNLVFKRREKDFYRTVTHKDFDGAMEKLVEKLKARLDRVGA